MIIRISFTLLIQPVVFKFLTRTETICVIGRRRKQKTDVQPVLHSSTRPPTNRQKTGIPPAVPKTLTRVRDFWLLTPTITECCPTHRRECNSQTKPSGAWRESLQVSLPLSQISLAMNLATGTSENTTPQIESKNLAAMATSFANGVEVEMSQVASFALRA